MQFSAPQASDILSAADVENSLLIVIPTEYRTGIVTRYGDKDGIVVSVVDLEDTDQATGKAPVYHGAVWFGGKLIGNLKNQIGQTLLARMKKGVAQNGNQPPWQLEDATGDPAAITKATTWAQQNPDFERTALSFVVGSAPAQRAAAPAPAPAAAPAPAPAQPAAAAGFNPATGEVTPELSALLEQIQAAQAAAK